MQNVIVSNGKGPMFRVTKTLEKFKHEKEFNASYNLPDSREIYTVW